MKEASQRCHYLKPLMLMTTRFDLSHDEITYHDLPINTMAQTAATYMIPTDMLEVFWEKNHLVE